MYFGELGGYFYGCPRGRRIFSFLAQVAEMLADTSDRNKELHILRGAHILFFEGSVDFDDCCGDLQLA